MDSIKDSPVLDISMGKLDVCANCSHQIFLRPEKDSTWMHIVPLVLRKRCIVKNCNCGGNGFDIYGNNFEKNVCGICKKGEICPCTNPQPMVLIKDGKSITN